MRALVVLFALTTACAAKPPPPLVCEPPPPEPKKIAIGACPISYSDAGSDADSSYDAPR